jgi:GH24 family phage-related lysozyme (muramidase)
MSYGTANTTNPSLIALVKSNEGFKPGYYPDAHGYSIGYGHFAKGNGSVPVAQILGYEPPNGIITRDEAEILLQYDLAKAKQGAYSVYPWLVKQPQLVQNHIIDMTYNLGVGGIQSFAPTMAHIEKGEYDIAANRLTRTKWYSQVGTRSQRIVNDLRQLSVDNINKIEENFTNGTDNKENNTTPTVNNSDKNISKSNESTTIKPNSTLVNTLNNQPSNSDTDMDINSYINDIGNDSKVKKLFNDVDTSPNGTNGTSESTTIKPNSTLVNTLNTQPSNGGTSMDVSSASTGKVEIVKPTST